MLCMDVRLLVGPKMGQLRGGDVVLNLVRPGFNEIVGMAVGFVLVVFRGKKHPHGSYRPHVLEDKPDTPPQVGMRPPRQRAICLAAAKAFNYGEIING